MSGMGVNLRVSHPSLANGLRTFDGSGFEGDKNSKPLNERKMKEWAPKKVTNKLEARPIKLKPIWIGPKIGNGSASRKGRI